MSRLRPRRIRTRLAILYAVLFLVAGSALSGLTYGLLASHLPQTRSAGKAAALKVARLGALCKQEAQLGKTRELLLLQRCRQAFAAGAKAGSQDQRDQTLNTLLVASLIGLGVATLASGGLGWFISGRALRPVRSITDTARRASELELGERIALSGPDDELKELADTFDLMLERLDAAFASQRRFVANAAHELRTPLTAMRTAIEVTLAKPDRTEQRRRWSRVHARSTGRRTSRPCSRSRSATAVRRAQDSSTSPSSRGRTRRGRTGARRAPSTPRCSPHRCGATASCWSG